MKSTEIKVLVLGGNGFVGNEIVRQLMQMNHVTPLIGSRTLGDKIVQGVAALKIDSTNLLELKDGLKGVDAVINCVTGDATTITQGAQLLCHAAALSGMPKIIHLSSQSVYGTQTGIISENTPLHDDLGWYGHAKIAAEYAIEDYGRNGGKAIILRPGCISGKDSPLWTERIITWLKQGKLGDLGASGDGWSNIVDVADVAQAATKALNVSLREGEVKIFNLSAPDSPRWNQYFVDFGVSIGATPIKRISNRAIKLDAYLLGIPIKIIEHILKKVHIKATWLPHGIPPSLLKLFRQEIKLDSTKATTELELTWTPYHIMLQNQTPASPKIPDKIFTLPEL